MVTEVVRKDLVNYLDSVVRPGQNVNSVDDDVNLIDAGLMDSLALIQIVLYLEQNHGLQFHTLGIDPSELASVGGILRAIDRAGP